MSCWCCFYSEHYKNHHCLLWCLFLICQTYCKKQHHDNHKVLYLHDIYSGYVCADWRIFELQGHFIINLLIFIYQHCSQSFPQISLQVACKLKKTLLLHSTIMSHQPLFKALWFQNTWFLAHNFISCKSVTSFDDGTIEFYKFCLPTSLRGLEVTL